MPSTTLQNLRRGFAEYAGYGELVGKDGNAWTTTTDIGASTVVVSTELRDYGFEDYSGGGSGDRALQNWWTQILGTTNANVVRRIRLYDASASQVTVTGTDLVAETGPIDFEIHKFSPTRIRSALNSARTRVRDVLYVPLSRSLVTAQGITRYEVPTALFESPTAIYLEKGMQSDYANNILTDGAFEVWTNSTTLTNWSGTTLDVTQEEETTSPKNYAVFRDANAARCTSQTGSVGTLLQTISSPGTYSGQRVSLSIWVYCLTPSVVSTQLTINGAINLGTNADAGLHRGSGWELLTHYEDMPVTVTSLTIGVSVVSTATDNTEFYVDEAIATVGPVQEPDRGGQLLRNWKYLPLMEDTTDRHFVEFPYEFPDNYRLRFEGKGMLGSVSAETDTMEIADPQTQLLYAYALAEIYRQLLQTPTDIDELSDRRRLTQVRDDIERLTELHGTSLMPRALNIPDWGV